VLAKSKSIDLLDKKQKLYFYQSLNTKTFQFWLNCLSCTIYTYTRNWWYRRLCYL